MLIDSFKTEIISMINDKADSIKIWKTLVNYKHLGMDKDTMYNALESLRSEASQNDDEQTEDTIMEYMDIVAGWCNPKWSIFP